MNSSYINKAFTRRPLPGLVIAALIAVAAGTGTVHAQAESAKMKQTVAAADPLAGDTWHAMAPSWPGTIRFDGKAKKMVLEPLGSNVIEGSYTVSEVAKKGETTTGKLRMVNSAGSVSESTFTLSGKDLKLAFAGGQQTETYKRLSAAEAEAEKAKLLKALREGRTRMINGGTTPK